jgi:predicted DNA-binding transcriptional regulator AlpA
MRNQASASTATMSKASTTPLSLDDRVLSLSEAAHLAGVSTDTLKRLNKREELRIVKLSPRRIGVRLSDLRQFIADRAA